MDELTTTNSVPMTLKTLLPYKRPAGVERFRSELPFVFDITASAPDGTSAVFFVRGGAKFIPGVGLTPESVALIGTPEVTSFKDAGASAWSASVSVDGLELRLEVTGDAALPVTWVLTAASLCSGMSSQPRLAWASR